MINARQDVYGFYRVGPFESYSKFAAIQEHVRTGLELEWIFNDDVYGACNWHQEPTQSLQELYAARAQQLRNRYDYLVLCYSGGADSDNILDTFVANDIKLDEVAVYVNFAATGDRNNLMNAEIYNRALPKVQHIQQKWPHLRCTVTDYSELIIKHFEQPNTLFDWIYTSNIHVHPGTQTRHARWKQSQPHWQKLFDQGRTVAFITGNEKPNVHGIKGKFWFHFKDTVDSARGAVQQTLDHAWDIDELFYWSPDAPQIPIKQAHVIKRCLQLARPDSEFVTSTRPNTYHNSSWNKEYNLFLDHNATHKLIYPSWTPNPWQAKPVLPIFPHQTEWFFKQSDNEPAKQAWRAGLEYRWQHTPDRFKVDRKKIAKGFTTLQSKSYCIG